MKRVIGTLLAILTITFWTTLSWAAVNIREDRSSKVIWAFLGFCALIVVAQLLPAIRSARQIAKEEARQASAAEAQVEGDK